jgi:hypothetical protein
MVVVENTPEIHNMVVCVSGANCRAASLR